MSWFPLWLCHELWPPAIFSLFFFFEAAICFVTQERELFLRGHHLTWKANLAFQVLLALVKKTGFHDKCFLPSSHCCTKFCCPVPTRLWVMAILPHLLFFQTFMELTRVGSCSVQSLSHVWLFVTPWTAALKASLSVTNSQSLLKLMSSKSVIPSNHLILCHPLLLLPSVFPTIRVFSNESALRIRWPKYWSFIFSISPSNEYSGLISFRIDWFYFFVVQRTLKSLLQHHSSKASIPWCSAFFIVQFSHPYMTTGKVVALTR